MCKFCENQQSVTKAPCPYAKVSINLEDDILEVLITDELLDLCRIEEFEIKFCPYCGKKLITSLNKK